MKNTILIEDLKYIEQNFPEREKLRGSTLLITGCAGFLGFYFLQFLASQKDSLDIKSIICLDNFRLGKPEWLDSLSKENKIKLYSFDIVTDDISTIEGVENVDYIIHMASIASPVFYRKYPIETLDANVWGLRKLLDYYKDKDIRGFLFFSSSEIYGDPEIVPTPEEYRGNVSSIGPRACYDEAKRFGETLCYLFAEQYQMPITVVRPFNNYGPGMKLDDKRVPADFAKAVSENKDIIIYSDGTPTRTYCYIADAITGYLKALVYGKFEYFNMGIDEPEISVSELANIYAECGKEVLGYSGKVSYEKPQEKDYLTHNPSRRCPDIKKAEHLLSYNPSIQVKDGVKRYLQFLNGEDL